MNKNQAANILSDELWGVGMALEKAGYIMQEILDEYFRKFERENQEDHIGITWEFKRYSVFAEMLGDYVHQAEVTIESLKNTTKKAA